MTKILLVEDDKSLREIYGVRLLAEGYDIVSAGDGEEALAMAIKERPQLIVSDVMMPKISGFDMLDILRSTTETKAIKVIMMTALSSEDQRARGESLGADRYLVKSQVGIEDVVRTVHEVLGDTPGAAPAGNVFAKQPPAAPAAGGARPAAPSASSSSVPQRPGTSPAAPAAPTPASPPAPGASPSAPQPVSPRPAPAQPAAPAAPQQPSRPAPAGPFSAATSRPPATRQQPAPAAPAQSSGPSGGNLPQPTAPFSTTRPAGLGDRIIHPVEQSASKPNFNELIAKELGTAAPAPTAPASPPAPTTPQPAPTPPPATTSGAQAQPATPAPTTPKPELTFEETPVPPRTPGVQPPQ